MDTVLVGVKFIPSKERVVVDEGAIKKPEVVDIYGMISPLIPVAEIVTHDPVGATVIHVPATTFDWSILVLSSVIISFHFVFESTSQTFANKPVQA